MIWLLLGLGLLVCIKLLNRPRPSRYQQTLWAESVRRRGLSPTEWEKEARILGYIK